MDYEDFYYKFSSLFKAEFQNQLDAINTRRTDFQLTKMQDWLDESLDDKAKNFNYFGFIGTGSPTGVGNGQNFAIDYDIEIDLFVPNSQINPAQFQKMLKRYNQVLLNTALAIWPKMGGICSPPTINILTPINASLNNSSKTYKLLGINLKFTMVM